MTNQECRQNHDRSYTFTEIDHTWQLLATLRNGPFAWPGGYPLYFITSDGAALSFKTVKEELRNILDSVKTDYGSSDGWRVTHCDINYEDGSLYDDHSGERIESAYAE